METHKSKLRLFILSALMVAIILDSQTALQSVAASMELCIRSVIPGVIPFLFLASAITSEIQNVRIPFLEKLLRIPNGTALFFIIGQLCGYPVGAKLLQNAADNKDIDQKTAGRMVCFCNNASPAFIIGILTSAFTNKSTAIYLWIIQIAASLILGIILPGTTGRPAIVNYHPRKDLGSVLADTLKTMSVICGWVIIWGVLLAYVRKLNIFFCNTFINIIFCGFIELTNGVFALRDINSEAIRFTLSGIFLSFGGICVLTQTRSVAPGVNIKYYFYCRLLHAAISASLCAVLSPCLFPSDSTTLKSIPLFLSTMAFGIILLIFNKINSSNQSKSVV